MSDNEEKIITMEVDKTTSPKVSTPTQKQPEDPNSTKNGGLNALLFIGSFLIVVGSCSLLMSAVSDMLKLAILLIITVVFYIAGLLIRKVKILILAGTAFTCTSLAVMPFLGFAFSEFTSVSPELSWLLTSLIGTIAYIIAALVIKSRVIAFFSMGFIVSLACSAPTNLHMAALWNYLAVILVSIISNMAGILFKEKIPTAYRDILTHTGRWLAAGVAVATLFGQFSLSGFDYSIIFAICLVQFIISYITGKDYSDEVLARAVAVPFILSLFWNVFPANSSEFAIIAGLVCIAQIVYSLFSSLLRPKDKDRAIPFVVVSFILSLFCPLFAAFKPNVSISPNTIGIVISSLNFILSILFAVFWKNKGWLVASYFFAVITPLYIDMGANNAKIILIIYALEFICFSIYYYFQKEKNKNLEIFNLVAFSILLCITRMACSKETFFMMATPAESIMFNMIALVVPAFAWLIFGLRDDNKNRIEVATYFFVSSIGITALHAILPSIESSSSISYITQLIVSNIILLSLGITSFYRKSYGRAITATSIFSWVALTTVAAISTASSRYTYYYWYGEKTELEKNIELITQLLFLVEEVCIAVIGAARRKKAVFWISTPTIILITLSLTSDMRWIWFIIIGVALITFVIWRLLSLQKEQASKLPEKTETKTSQAPAQPAQPQTPPEKQGN